MYKDVEDHMKMCKAAVELNEPITQREELKKVSVSATRRQAYCIVFIRAILHREA